MAVTLGQVRIALLKTPHGAGHDLELLTERINARYFEILNAHPWTQLHSASTLSVVASYETGTLAITTATTSVTLTDGTFPTNLSGGRLRVGTDSEWYVFTRTGATTGTLDRNYEADTVTVATFKLWQPIYSLPSDLDILDSITVPSQGWELDESSQEAIDEADAARERYGHPETWANYTRSSDATPLPRIELWPGPEDTEGLTVRYRTAGSRFAVTPGTTEFPTWIDTDAVIYGVEADILADQGNPLYQVKETKFQQKVAQMFSEDCQRMAPTTLGMTDRYTFHRIERELGEFHADRKATLLRSI